VFFEPWDPLAGLGREISLVFPVERNKKTNLTVENVDETVEKWE
jgi:hypothetical protein